MNLDLNYWATDKERTYVKETLDKEGVKKLFEKELVNLGSKIVKNFHNDNYATFEVQKKFETEKTAMKTIINADPDMKKKYETALAKNKTRGGFSEGILLLQTIAIKCVNIINTKESVENKLSSRNEVAYKSQAMDGILGPNTFYVLASIAKEKNISFDGVVDKPLVDQMISICGETPSTENKTPEAPKNAENKTEKKDQPSIVTKTEDETDKNNKVNTPVVIAKEEGKKVEVKKETNPLLENQTPVVTTKEEGKISTDEVFTIIDTPDKNIDPDFYNNRKKLTETEKTTTKQIYQKIMDANKEESKIKIIIDGLDTKILWWLKDVLVKKILLTQKAKNKESKRFQSIAQMVVIKENALSQQNVNAGDIAVEVKRMQWAIEKYTLPAQEKIGKDNTYTIEKTDENYNENKIGYDKIQSINFMLKNNGTEIGIVKFDRQGELITTEIKKDGRTYILWKQGTMIIIQKQGI